MKVKMILPALREATSPFLRPIKYFARCRVFRRSAAISSSGLVLVPKELESALG